MARIVKNTRELPIDKGYAWLVAIGAFINLFMSLGMYRIYGVIFLEVLDYYDTSSALSSTMFGIFMLTCALALVVHTLVVDKLTERTMGIIGGVSFGLSLILQVFSPNIYYFIIIFGILGGFGSTYTMYTAIISLGVYFDKRLSLASGLAFTGSSVGQLVIPQLMKLILNNYDLKGAMLILGGIQLHPLISAMLFRPKSFYERYNKESESVIPHEDIDISNDEPIRVEIIKPLEKRSIEDSIESLKHDDNKTGSFHDESSCLNNIDVILSEENEIKPLKLMSSSSPDVRDRNSLSDKHSNESLHSDNNVSQTNDPMIETNIKLNPKDLSKEGFSERDSNDDLKEKDDTTNKDPKVIFSLKQSIKILCSSPRFILFTCGRCFSILAMYLVILFLPPYATDNGCTMSQVTLMLSVVGFCDLPSRPFHGWIVSFKAIDATYYVGVTTLMASVVIFICIFMPSYESVFIMGIGQGIFYNPVLCLMNVIIIDSVGVSLFPRAMMFTMITMYGCMTFLPSVFGILYDTLGSYQIPMCIAAGCGIFGGILTIVERKTR